MKIHPYGLTLALCLSAVLPHSNLWAQEPTQSESNCGNAAVGSIVKSDSFAEVAAGLAKIPTKKGEFETSEAFARRARQVTAQGLKPVVLPTEPVLDADLTAPGKLFEGGFSYDADMQELLIRPSIFSWGVTDYKNPESLISVGVGLWSMERDVPRGKFIASNAMNAHIVAERKGRTTQIIYSHDAENPLDITRLSESPFVKGENPSKPLFELSMAPEAARAFKKQFKIYAIVRPKAPYTASYSRVLPATFDSPVELSEKITWIIGDITCALLVDGTGKVLATREGRIPVAAP